MATWMRVDMDFGLPVKIFTLGQREWMAASFFKDLSREILISNSPETLAKMVTEFLIKTRPALKEGLIVAMVDVSAYKQEWQFTCCHPNFPRVAHNQLPPMERLCLCPVCHSPLQIEAIKRLMVVDGSGNGIEVCSEKCGKLASVTNVPSWRDSPSQI